MPTFVNGLAVTSVADQSTASTPRVGVVLTVEDGLDWASAPTDATDLVVTLTPSQNGGVKELVLPLTKNLAEGGGGLWHAIEQINATVGDAQRIEETYVSLPGDDVMLVLTFSEDLPWHPPFRFSADVRPAKKGLRFGIPHYQDVKGANMVPRSRSATRRGEFTHPNPTWAGARPFILRDNPFFWFFLDETEILRVHDDKRVLFSDPLMFNTDTSRPPSSPTYRWGDRINKINVGGTYAEIGTSPERCSLPVEGPNGMATLGKHLQSNSLPSSLSVHYYADAFDPTGPIMPSISVVNVENYIEDIILLWASGIYIASIRTVDDVTTTRIMRYADPDNIIDELVVPVDSGVVILAIEPHSVSDIRFIAHTEAGTVVKDVTDGVPMPPGYDYGSGEELHRFYIKGTGYYDNGSGGPVAGAAWLNWDFVDMRDQVQHMAERYGLPDVVVPPVPFAARSDAGPKPVAGSVTGAHHQKPHGRPRPVPREKWPPDDAGPDAHKPSPPPDHVLGPAKKEPVMEHELPDALKRVTLPAVPPPPPMGVPGDPVAMDAGRTDDGQVVFTVAGWQLGNGRSLALSVFAREGMDLHKLDAQVSLRAGLLRPTIIHALAQALRNGHGTQLVVYEHDWGVSVRGMAGTTVVDAALAETGA